MLNKKEFCVKKVELSDAKKMCVENHYLHRVPSIVACYGLFKIENDSLMGIITYGIPPSHQLMKVCGEEYKKNVVELNRLWCDDSSPKNSESYLISQSLKLLRQDKEYIKIIISFADTREGHLGYVYQATNWNFIGYSVAGGGSVLIEGKEYHQKSLNNKYGTSKIESLKEIFKTEDIVYRPRSKKCRYINFIGSKKEKKLLKSLCKYEIQETYPKELPINTTYYKDK